jgi:glucosamine--fructose-6-phosphate aminotransferase (isomerizing)
MCGIISFFGTDCFEYLINGLKQLQNRGYDSAGICGINKDRKWVIHKYASTENINALNELEKRKDEYKGITNGIAHTRWATHGPKTDINSHPHMSQSGLFSIVHNGIIENFHSLKQMLIENGFAFQSETDSEVIANLLEFNYEGDVKMCIQKTINNLEGTWGLAIICLEFPEQLFCTRHGSPLLVGRDDNIAIVTSEQSGFCGLMNDYIVLQNNDICLIEKIENKIAVITNESYDLKKTTASQFISSPHPYPHWTLREINEQIDSSLRAISLGGRLLSNNEVKLGGLDENKVELMEINHLVLLGCGTSYFSGLMAIHFFKELGNFHSVQILDGADFNENDIPKNGKTALVLISQSGETKDLHRCIQIGKQHDLFLIGLVNVVDSLIAREVHCGCYLNAGREVAVASTKAYSSQVILLSMIAVWFAQQKDLYPLKRTQYVKDIRNLQYDIKYTLEKNTFTDDLLDLVNKPSCFLLGKGKGESVAKEGALKIKEISYIHAEGYSTSSLKHGPFALLEKDFPVILLAPHNEHYSKSENAYEEIKSRHASIVWITNKESDKQNCLYVANNETFLDLLMVIPLQLMAYHLSVKKELNPDMPRNLAKVVTVE